MIHLLLLFYCPAASADTEALFYFSPQTIEAQKHIAALRLDKARAILDAEKKLYPNNTAIDFLQNYVDYYHLVSSQQVEDIKKLEVNKSKRLDRLKKIPESSPYHLYTQSEVHLQWAFSKVFNQEFVSAMLDFRSAYNLAEENTKKFPSFKQSQKTVGLIKAMLSTVPDNYKWVLSIAGLKGNYEEGLGLIKDYLNQQHISDDHWLDMQSTAFYYVLLQLNFGDKNEAWKYCEKFTSDHTNNLMNTYLRAFTASKTAHNEECIRTLSVKPKTADYAPFYALDYLMGVAKLNRLDEDADIYLKKFVTFYKGKNLVKDAYKRLSWYSLLQNDKEKFKIYQGLAKKYGASNSEEDQNAQKEAVMGIYPDVTLLKAHLLFDGGYYAQAEEMIKLIQPEQLGSGYQKIEYYYRYGRILQETNKLGKAIEMFNKTTQLGEKTSYYFAPNACLQLGYIYLKLNFRETAKTHFSKVLEYKNYEYKSSISQKARTELQKLEQ